MWHQYKYAHNTCVLECLDLSYFWFLYLYWMTDKWVFQKRLWDKVFSFVNLTCTYLSPNRIHPWRVLHIPEASKFTESLGTVNLMIRSQNYQTKRKEKHLYEKKNSNTDGKSCSWKVANYITYGINHFLKKLICDRILVLGWNSLDIETVTHLLYAVRWTSVRTNICIPQMTFNILRDSYQGHIIGLD